MSKKNKPREGLVYSTDPDYQPEETHEEQETLPADKQQLIVYIDRKQRGGKSVTIVDGFIGMPDDLKTLSKLLKNKCGVGGSEKDGQILIQGEFRDKIAEILKAAGYNRTKIR
jgi:translation initiation factor 1